MTVSEETMVVKETVEMSDEYLVYPTDGSPYQVVLKNEDLFWHWKWNSSDIQADIDEGKTYRFRICGWRIPILSEYPCIIEILEEHE
jgi:hypothetical protein